ncbi:MAG: hypothetical protein AB1560_01905 [Pseudomonadota bacterium]
MNWQLIAIVFGVILGLAGIALMALAWWLGWLLKDFEDDPNW